MARPYRLLSAPYMPPLPWATRVVAPLALGAGLGYAVWREDRAIFDTIRSLKPSGDIARELETLGQFGSVGTLVIVLILVALLDRERVRRMLDWGFAYLLGGLLFTLMKVGLGRARPKLGDPDLFVGAGGVVTTDDGETLRATLGESVLQSMPSSHTTHAVIAAVFLGVMYPRVRPFVYAWAALVGVLRVVHGAHWPSDVVVGAGVAYPLAYLCATRFWGVRALDWFWVRVIDRDATPEFPRLRALERPA